MTERTSGDAPLRAIATRVGRLRDDLDRTDRDPDALTRALDLVGRSLDMLGTSCDDDELVLRLGSPRAVAATYVRATAHLSEAGVTTRVREDVLERGRDRVLAELTELQRDLLAPQTGGR